MTPHRCSVTSKVRGSCCGSTGRRLGSDCYVSNHVGASSSPPGLFSAPLTLARRCSHKHGQTIRPGRRDNDDGTFGRLGRVHGVPEMSTGQSVLTAVSKSRWHS